MDEYATNPLAEMLAERDPSRYAAVTRVSEPPKMFANGTADVPAFTASGIDPQHLLKLPYGMRHAAATNPDINQVYDWFETYASIPEAEVDTEGLRNYRARAEDWLANTDPRTPEEIQAQEQADAAMYEAYVRSMDRDGMTPEERKQKRTDDWNAKQQAAADEQQRQAEHRRGSAYLRQTEQGVGVTHW